MPPCKINLVRLQSNCMCFMQKFYNLQERNDGSIKTNQLYRSCKGYRYTMCYHRAHVFSLRPRQYTGSIHIFIPYAIVLYPLGMVCQGRQRGYKTSDLEEGKAASHSLSHNQHNKIHNQNRSIWLYIKGTENLCHITYICKRSFGQDKSVHDTTSENCWYVMVPHRPVFLPDNIYMSEQFLPKI